MRPKKLSTAHRRELLDQYAEHCEEIRRRLHEFKTVPRRRYFIELCYCLLTPQSNARQCSRVADELERLDFENRPFNPESLLRSFNGGYVRFHKKKAERLLAARSSFPPLLPYFESIGEDKELRLLLAGSIVGLGFKEASHFLRNIGRTRLAIIDRHIIRNLLRIGLIEESPRSISRSNYLRLETIFEELASDIGIPEEELDLLLWRRETGEILK